MLNCIANTARAALILGSLVLSQVAAATLSISESNNAFLVTTDQYSWTLSKTRFSVIESASKAGREQLASGAAEAQFMGKTIRFGAPSEFSNGDNWVEIRGWASQADNLWYVARYEFADGQPHAKVAVTLTDRHEKSEVEGHWHSYWRNRMLSNVKYSVTSVAPLVAQSYSQLNAFSGFSDDSHKISDLADNGQRSTWSGTTNAAGKLVAYQRVADRTIAKNQFTWLPKGIAGEAELLVEFGQLDSSIGSFLHKAAQYEITHANGTQVVTIDQGAPQPISLGRFNLNDNSKVTLRAGNRTEAGTRFVVAGSLVVRSNSGTDIIDFSHLQDDEIDVFPSSFAVLDLWKHHPIRVFANTDRQFGVVGALEAVELNAGSSITLDLGFSLEGNASGLASYLREAPVIGAAPDWWSLYDGTLNASEDYDRYVGRTPELMQRADDDRNNYGWREYGDYQIGAPYYDGEGLLHQDWGSNQYDLATGLGLAWIRTGNPLSWQRWRAAVRFQMDTGISKFQPIRAKHGGAGRRKGDCTYALRIVCQEPIIEYSQGFRSLLLYHHYTGEEWAKDIAKMQIDGLAYNANRDLDVRWYIERGDRGPIWIMKGLLMGAKVFPEGTTHYSKNTFKDLPVGTSYRALLDRYMAAILDSSDAAGHYPGDQPVWKGQIYGVFAEYHDLLVAEGNTALAARVRQRILQDVDTYMTSWYRVNQGKHEVLYQISRGNWYVSGNYPWLWIDALAIAYRLSGEQKYANFAEQMYTEADRLFSAKNVESPRNWSSVLTYTGVYFDTFRSGGERLVSKTPKPPVILE